MHNQVFNSTAANHVNLAPLNNRTAWHSGTNVFYLLVNDTHYVLRVIRRHRHISPLHVTYPCLTILWSSTHLPFLGVRATRLCHARLSGQNQTWHALSEVRELVLNAGGVVDSAKSGWSEWTLKFAAPGIWMSGCARACFPSSTADPCRRRPCLPATS